MIRRAFLDRLMGSLNDLTSELDAPLDIGRVTALAHGPEDATQIYATSLFVVDPEAPA